MPDVFTLQEKILRRLEERLRLQIKTGESDDQAETSELQQTRLGNWVIGWKDRLQRWGVLRILKKIPGVSGVLQNRYWRLTRAQKIVPVQELLQFTGEEFLQKAYAAIVERATEHEALKHYLRLMRGGMPKEVVLFFLARSPEAKKINVHLSGFSLTPKIFWKYRLRETAKRLPLVSPGLLWGYKIFRLPARFYGLVLTVQDLQDRMERLERELKKK
jgi:hypothetical protein